MYQPGTPPLTPSVWRLHVTGSEIRIMLEDEEGNVIPARCVIKNVSGFIVNSMGIRRSRQTRERRFSDPSARGVPCTFSPVHQSYSTKESLQPKRYQARLVGTTYVYDFPGLFSKALQNVWAKAHSLNSSLSPPKKLIKTKELASDENDQLAEVDTAIPVRQPLLLLVAL